PSLLSRESTTLSFSNPQNGHFIVFYSGTTNRCVNWIVTGGKESGQLDIGSSGDRKAIDNVRFSDYPLSRSPASSCVLCSSSRLSSSIFVSDTCSDRARPSPAGTTDMNVTSQSMMPQLVASSGERLKTPRSMPIVASCEPPPTTGSCS